MLDGTSQYPREEQPRSPDAISPEEIREQLRRILSSATFRNAPRHRLFLDFVVKQALSEKKENLREATIGRRVFDQDYPLDSNWIPCYSVLDESFGTLSG